MANPKFVLIYPAMDHLPGLQIREMLQAITTTQFGIQLNCMNCKIIYKNDCAIQPKVNLLFYCRLLKKCAILSFKTNTEN